MKKYVVILFAFILLIISMITFYQSVSIPTSFLDEENISNETINASNEKSSPF